ncbi:MAG TPA: hypothetical protein VMW16_06930 [Sedimentisphaerales bacterium]|nr:hypothetical protein [Sedimentisphaerales bacterium]
MEEEKVGKLLNALAERTAERVRPELAEQIKQHIPSRLIPYRKGIDTVNIIIDLRVSKLAAAAAIIITMILLASFFGGPNPTGSGIYQDGKLLIRYCLGGRNVSNNDLTSMSRLCEYLTQQGKDVVFYGEGADRNDSNSVLMQWKISDDRYRVIFSDLREAEVSAEELIRLQAQMLQQRK